MMKSLLIGLSLFTLLYTWDVDPARGLGSRVPAVGMPAADFKLKDLDGKVRTLADYSGKVVLLNFWATWCKPCTTEMPAMQSAYDRLKDEGLVVVAVNELEDEARVREHIAEYGHTFPVLLDRDNDVANLYGVFGLPVSVFIDRNGTVQEYVKGSLLTEEKIQAVFDRLRAGSQAQAAVVK